MKRWPESLALSALTALGLACSGCSFLFTTAPPPNAEKYPPNVPIECTSKQTAPVVDSIIGGLEVVRAIYAATADDTAYVDAPFTREVDIGLGVGLAAVFIGSAVYGFSITSECRAVRLERLNAPVPGAQPTPPVVRAPGSEPKGANGASPAESDDSDEEPSAPRQDAPPSRRPVKAPLGSQPPAPASSSSAPLPAAR